MNVKKIVKNVLEDFSCKYCSEYGCNDVSYHERKMVKLTIELTKEEVKKILEKYERIANPTGLITKIKKEVEKK